YAPFKPGHKGTHAERARAVGLEAPAQKLLSGQNFGLECFINPSKKGLESAGDVEKGIKHIVADIVSKDKEITDQARSICDICGVLLESSRTKTKCAQDKKGDIKAKPPVTDSVAQKFEQYFNFKMPVKLLKSYQVLALNRGEDLKVLNVKLIVPDRARAMLLQFTSKKYLKDEHSIYQKSLIRQAIEDAYDRLIEPSLCRKIRSDLTANAEKASISVFNSNLKNLLLVSPVKYKTIFGIDPGFKNGCKVAVISPTGQVVDTDVLYLHDFKANKTAERNKMVAMVLKYRCDIIAIGNGTACRETESAVADLIKQGQFKPLLVVYSIVDECGASIYSVSDVAKKEFPDLDPTLRGAVSIARRLQDPLAELVKIEPKHLGVGMYQHDINKVKLETALSSVVEECVSFVGVDINTCSECLLRRVAGLNATKAKHIIEWRLKNGFFKNRQQLLSIKGLGKKGFEQCAGFIRVTNHASGDSLRLMEYFEADASAIGQDHFISLFKRKSTEENLKKFCEEQSVGFATVKFISDALKQPLSYDLREGSQKPLFKQDIISASDLRPGSELTGRVLNVTHFGAFVDIGVKINGLIHNSKMGRHGKLAVGDRVEVKVESIDLDRQRIGLVLQNVNRT
ncbi:S1 RNA-binding domain-containing protein 1, partial [Elysia marginata]